MMTLLVSFVRTLMLKIIISDWLIYIYYISLQINNQIEAFHNLYNTLKNKPLFCQLQKLTLKIVIYKWNKEI